MKTWRSHPCSWLPLRRLGCWLPPSWWSAQSACSSCRRRSRTRVSPLTASRRVRPTSGRKTCSFFAYRVSPVRIWSCTDGSERCWTRTFWTRHLTESGFCRAVGFISCSLQCRWRFALFPPKTWSSCWRELVRRCYSPLLPSFPPPVLPTRPQTPSSPVSTSVLPLILGASWLPPGVLALPLPSLLLQLDHELFQHGVLVDGDFQLQHNDFGVGVDAEVVFFGEQLQGLSPSQHFEEFVVGFDDPLILLDCLSVEQLQLQFDFLLEIGLELQVFCLCNVAADADVHSNNLNIIIHKHQ